MTPIGCLPIVITLYSSNSITNRTCIESLSSVAKDYNSKLEKELYSLQLNHAKSGSRIAYLDSYTLMQDIVTNSLKFGEFIHSIFIILLTNLFINRTQHQRVRL